MRTRGIGRTPGNDGAGVGEDRPGRLKIDERGDERRAVGDEKVPSHGCIVTADLLDGSKIDPRIDLIAIDGARQQHACEARLVQLRQERLRNPAGALDFIRDGSNGSSQAASASYRVGAGAVVHAPSREIMRNDIADQSRAAVNPSPSLSAAGWRPAGRASPRLARGTSWNLGAGRAYGGQPSRSALHAPAPVARPTAHRAVAARTDLHRRWLSARPPYRLPSRARRLD